MNSTRNIIILVISCIFGLSVYAQPGFGRRIEDQMQAIEARRVAHITEKLSLTPREARVFWPVYNEYLGKVNELSQKQREWFMEINRTSDLSDGEWAKLAEREVLRIEQSALLRREYHEKLKEILPIKKVALLYEAELSFNRLLVRESQHRMRGRE
jgi:hypothetical protein